MQLRVTPLLEGAAAPSFVMSRDALTTPRTFIDLLDQRKAVYLESTDDNTPLTPDDFGQLVVDLQLEQYPYIGGAAPRTIIPVKAGKDIVFTANERFVTEMRNRFSTQE